MIDRIGIFDKPASHGAYSSAMKLNADVGEGVGNDETLFRWIDLANVACGGHAGGSDEMKRTVDLAQTYGVAVGAHPGYPDRENFGRKSIPMESGGVKRLVLEQVGSLYAICQEMGAELMYVKPHGALYHDMMRSTDVLEEIFQAVSKFPHVLAMMVMAQANNEPQKRLAGQYAVPLLFEAFADRVYTDEGALMDRSFEGAVYASPEQMIAQVMQVAKYGSVTTANGATLPLKADTICVHGDNETSIEAAQQIHQALRA